MTKKEFPEEAEKTIYQRDKTAKEPIPDKETPKPVAKPKVKPRKVFVPKKMVAKTDKPMEYRVRHILVSSLEAAQLFRQSILDFQKDLADQPLDDPDKEFHDREKIERFFSRLAKKYSVCPTKALGGGLDWIHKGMEIKNDLFTTELVDLINQTEKFTVPEPVKTSRGFHLILVCESQPHIPEEKPAAVPQAKTPPPGSGIPT